MKKTRILLAMLMCIAMLASLVAVNVSAAGETVVSEANFMGLTPADKGDASHAAMEAQGVTIPEDSGAWQIVDHFYKVALPADGHSVCTYIQTLEAGEGKVFADDVAFEVAYGLAKKDADGNPLPQVGHLIVYVSTDGENWTEGWANREGQGKLYDSTAFAVNTATLAGTAGQSKIYIKVEMVRYSAETSGCMGYTKMTAVTRGLNEVVSSIDARNAKGVPAGSALIGDAAKAEIERLGYTIEGEHPWMLNDCYHVFMTPKDGFQECKLVQTLEAGAGKVFAEDVKLNTGYWLAAVSDMGWFVVEVSTDGENWKEAYVDETGNGEEYQLSSFIEKEAIALEGTKGASKVYVRYSVCRHSGPCAGGLTYSTLYANVEAGAASDNAPTGDAIGMVVALLAVSGTALVVLKKKEN